MYGPNIFKLQNHKSSEPEEQEVLSVLSLTNSRDFSFSASGWPLYRQKSQKHKCDRSGPP